MEPINCFWIGAPLSELELTCLRSWIRFHPVILYSYQQIELPADLSGVQLKDAMEILSQDYFFEYNKRTPAYKYLPFADLFRFTMLHKKGGIWLDLDLILQRPINQSLLETPYAFSAERTIQKGAYRNREFKEIADIGFLYIKEPNSALTSYILERIPAKFDCPFKMMLLYRKGLKELGLQKYVLPARIFLPLDWWFCKEAILTNLENYPSKYGVSGFERSCLDDPEVIGIHWWRAILRKRNILLENAKPHSLWTITKNKMLNQNTS